jgi:hypothetical protein
MTKWILYLNKKGRWDYLVIFGTNFVPDGTPKEDIFRREHPMTMEIIKRNKALLLEEVELCNA